MTRYNGLNSKTNQFTRRLFTEHKHKCSFSGIKPAMRVHVWVHSNGSTWSHRIPPGFFLLELSHIANMHRLTLQTSTSMSSEFKSIVFPWPLITVAVSKGLSGSHLIKAPNAIPSTGQIKVPLLFKEEALRSNQIKSTENGQNKSKTWLPLTLNRTSDQEKAEEECQRNLHFLWKFLVVRRKRDDSNMTF